MNGYLLDTSAASILWDVRHREHGILRSFLQEKAQSPIWVSVVVLGEIEYGLKTATKMDVDLQREVRRRTAEYPILDVEKHTTESFSDLRAALFEKYAPRDRRTGRFKVRWPEDLRERTTSKELGIQENDIWVAAQAIQYNLVLITDDYMRRLEEVSRILVYPLQLATWK